MKLLNFNITPGGQLVVDSNEICLFRYDGFYVHVRDRARSLSSSVSTMLLCLLSWQFIVVWCGYRYAPHISHGPSGLSLLTALSEPSSLLIGCLLIGHSSVSPAGVHHYVTFLLHLDPRSCLSAQLKFFCFVLNSLFSTRTHSL